MKVKASIVGDGVGSIVHLEGGGRRITGMVTEWSPPTMEVRWEDGEVSVEKIADYEKNLKHGYLNINDYEQIYALVEPYIIYERKDDIAWFRVPAEVAQRIVGILPENERRKRHNSSPTLQAMADAASSSDGLVEGYLKGAPVIEVLFDGVHVREDVAQSIQGRALHEADEIDFSDEKPGYVRLWWD